MDRYSQKDPNDSTLGKTFEGLCLLRSFLTLKENEALAREIKDKLKFDDIVIRVTTNNVCSYRCFQLKHKDTTKNREHSITWNDLLLKEKSPFFLKEYFDSYTERDKSRHISELGIVTNVTFSTSSTAPKEAFTNNLKLITKNWVSQKAQLKKNQRPKSITHYVTEEDLEFYFEIIPDGTECTFGIEKSFKFSQQGLDHVIKAFKTINQNVDDLKLVEFLKLLVFHVGLPHANELERIIQTLLKVHVPFNWDTAHLERYQRIKLEVFELFKPIQEDQADWITARNRVSIFRKFTQDSKKYNILGSVKSYEVNVLELLYDEMHFDQLVSSRNEKLHQRIMLDKSLGEKGNAILNVYSSNSNTTVTALKLLKILKTYELELKALIILASDKTGIANILQYFQNLNREVSSLKSFVQEKFWCIIEFSPFFESVDFGQSKLLTQELFKLDGLKNWIRFIVITQHKIQENAPISIVDETGSTAVIESLEDEQLEWKNLPAKAKEHLAKKPLLIEEFAGCTTNLEALGLSDKLIAEQINSLFLAELITLDKQKPLCFGLAEYDINLESIYIDRKLKLPLVNIEQMDDHLKNRIIFDRHEECSQDTDNNQCTRHYLLKPGLKDEQISNRYLWFKSSSPKGFKEIRKHVTRSFQSTLEISETHLLQEDVCFGSGSEGGKLVIVVDLPGKGKSWLLSNLTNKFLDIELPQKENELLSRLMFRINLLEIKQSVWDKSITMNGDTTMEEKLTYITEQVLGLQVSKLSACIIKMCLTNSDSSLFFLLDGFDEISDKQRETIKSVVQALMCAKGVKRVILASRPDEGLENVLEDDFLQFPLHLTDLDKQDQVELLMKRWKRKQGDQQYEKNETLIKEYARSLVDYAQEALIAKNKNFLDIPLQCMIVSECFYQDLINFLENFKLSNLDLPQFTNENFELLRLYDYFVKAKMGIMFENKANLFDGNETLGMIKLDLVSLLEHAMKRLAIFHMMRATLSDAEIICRLPWDLYRKTKYAEDLKRAMKLGMIHGLSVAKSFSDLESPHAKFLHRTFAEYFFAKLLIDNFTGAETDLWNNPYLSEDVRRETFEVFIDHILINKEYAGVRRFFDRMLSDRLPSEERKCPFSMEDRLEVCIKWPCIGKQEFNRRLVKWVQDIPEEMSDGQDIKKVSEEFLDSMLKSKPSEPKEAAQKRKSKNQSKGSTNQRKSKHVLKAATAGSVHEPETLLKQISHKTIETRFNKLLRALRSETPKIALMLIYCIKEYECRPDVPQHVRTSLAHVIALLIRRLVHVGDKFSPDGKWIMGVFLRWFDPPVNGQSSSETFFIIFNNFISMAPTERVVQTLDLACSVVEHHRNICDFDKKIKTFVRSFIEKKDILERYTIFFKSRDSQDMKRMSRYFIKILSLSKLILPDTSLLDWLVNWFQSEQLNSDDAVPAKNPFMIIKTADFLIKALQEQKSELSESIAECYFEFLNKKLSSFFNNSSSDDNKLWCLWLLILSDRIMNTCKQSDVPLRYFKTGIGRSVLIAYAIAKCCRHERVAIMSLGAIDPLLIDHLNQWLKDKLAKLWNEVDEFEFIDFLFKTQQQQLPLRYSEGGQEDMTCLFSSDLVVPYISNSLTKEGLEYLIELCATESLPVPTVQSSLRDSLLGPERRCVKFIRHLPDMIQHYSY